MQKFEQEKLAPTLVHKAAQVKCCKILNCIR